MAEELGFDFRQWKEVFLFSKASRPTLEELTPSSYTTGTEGSVTQGKAAGGINLTTQLHLRTRIRMVELYLHCPIRLHGMVLN
jgi:hypothetical protein